MTAFFARMRRVHIYKFIIMLSFLLCQTGDYFIGFLCPEDIGVTIIVKWCIRNSIQVLFQVGSLKTVCIQNRAGFVPEV